MTDRRATGIRARPAGWRVPAGTLFVLAAALTCGLAAAPSEAPSETPSQLSSKPLPAAQPVPPSATRSCDPALLRNDSRPISYRQRGDRCEGIYSRRVSAFGAQLISFTGQSDLRDLCATGRPVHMVLPTPGTAAAPVRLRGESLRPDLYYRVDAELRSSGSFEWPFDPRCNNEVRLTAAELALMARRAVQVGTEQVDALVPVSLSFDAAAAAQPPFRALVMPGRRAREVFVSLLRYDGTTRVRVFAERPLNRRPYAPDTAIPVILNRPDLAAPGLYRADVTLQFESGEVETISFHFTNGR